MSYVGWLALGFTLDIEDDALFFPSLPHPLDARNAKEPFGVALDISVYAFGTSTHRPVSVGFYVAATSFDQNCHQATCSTRSQLLNRVSHLIMPLYRRNTGFLG
jgi:hypothetical protein